MGKPLVSVYMTVKNGSRWIRFAIDSIRAQTLKEWELVVVDDGSTDNTLSILEGLTKEDHRIKVIPTEGVGRGAALNLALAHCLAGFVANLDVDDLAHPRRLEVQYRFATEHPDFSLLFSEFLVVEEEGFPEWPSVSPESATVSDVTEKLAYYNPIDHSSVFAKREAIYSVGGYDQRLRGNLDYDLWVRLAEAGHRLGKINLQLAAKRWHDGQSFEARKHLAYVLDSLRIQSRAIKSLRPGMKAWLYLAGRLGWALVPRRLRLYLRSVWK